ncbi:MAG: pyruvate dehydrogenase complex dihydrolipoamide acetyltransferase [Robiginitomaculum sp.]|nr:MAG: pyruvate dehydrogenase complex dihydrolipoamide acetyltransferase [Robiginitomaculum sp.]
MPIDILMPALSPTMEEGILAKWMIKEGDTVSSGDILAEIETDKASMEIETIEEGVIAKILVQGGTENVKVNTVIAILLEEGEDMSAITDRPAALQATPIAANPEPVAPTKAPIPASPASAAKPPQTSGDQRIKASPLARRMAAQENLDLSKITGTGTGGRVVKRDIAAAMASGATMTAPADTQIQSDGFDLIALDGMRKTIASRMTASFRDVPHFPLNIDCRIDALLATRKAINLEAADDGIKISVNDFVVRAVALALKKVPEANASYTPEGLKLWHNADVAIAVAIDGGLITPVIRAAQTKGLATISAETKDMAGRARIRKLMPEEYQGGTFTVSNLGMMGIKSFASIINEPQGCILSVGAGEQRPVVNDGALAIATVMSVTLTCDHRVVDGSVGARFLAAFKAMIENPGLMLL